MIIPFNFQFKQLERRSLKKSARQQDSNPWPPRYRCDALPTELWSHTLGARSIYWVHISREEWNDVKYIWNNSYLNCGCRWKWRMIIAVNFQFKQLERRSLKNQGFNGIRTRDLCDTGAMKPHIRSEVNLLSSYLPWGVKLCEIYMK